MLRRLRVWFVAVVGTGWVALASTAPATAQVPPAVPSATAVEPGYLGVLADDLEDGSAAGPPATR